MASNKIRNEVDGASKVFMISAISVTGANKYTIGTNMISWDSINRYTIEQIASTFGQSGTTESTEQKMFRCGNSYIPLFDFGLLYTCFSAMRTAQIELGNGVPTESVQSSVPGIDVAWFGNEAVVYGAHHAVLVRLLSADVQNACRHNQVVLPNFIDAREFSLVREQDFLVLETEHGEILCTFSIAVSVRRSYPILFGAGATSQPTQVLSEDGEVYGDKTALEQIMQDTIATDSIEDTISKYSEQLVIDSVVVRSDLICQPTKRYKDRAEFLGSICYTDKGEIALAINFRKNLLVWRPWFIGDAVPDDTIQMDSMPKFEDFYDVKEECERIMCYANSVTVRPLTAAQFNLAVYERIRELFFSMQLSRIPLASSFGKIVIPESTLVRGLQTTVGESMYCIVPVGVIGDNFIVKSSSGTLDVMKGNPWGTEEYFYDVTEVINEIR